VIGVKGVAAQQYMQLFIVYGIARV